jgi:hypothetical protein
MHSAPSVSYPVGRSLWVAAFLLAAWGLGALACAAWAWEGGTAFRLAAGVVAIVVAGASATGWWRRQRSGMLAWDGGGWRWSQAHRTSDLTAIQVVADLQAWILLRCDGESGPRWIWAERAQLPARWGEFRRAVYSPANPEALPGAGPPSAEP